MLFDLSGKRRRVVQATYLTLAVLMGGGLVLFGIGSDVQGGILDAFKGGGSGQDDSGSIVSDRVEQAEERLRTNPHDVGAMTEVIRGNYQLASDRADPNTGTFPPQARPPLERAAGAWQAYLRATPRPDPSLATLMSQAYAGLAQPAEAARAAEIVTQARPTSAQAFLILAQFAAQAGQKRKAELAGQRAIELAPKSQRRAVEQEVKRLTQAGALGGLPGAAGSGGAAAGGTPGGGR